MAEQQQTNTSKLTTEEFKQLQKDALKLYNDAIWNMADLVSIGVKKFGKMKLVEMTPFPVAKIDWLLAIASVKPRNNSTIPEMHYEVCKEKDGKYWLKKALQENWNPVQLRQQLRKKNQQYKRQQQLKVSNWSKNLMLAENELKRCGISNPQAVADRLQPLVDLYHSLKT